MSPSSIHPDTSGTTQETVRTCTACGRLLIPGQAVCACGTAAPSLLQKKRNPFDFGKILPFIPFGGAIILLYLILNPTLIQYTIMPALKISAITFLASAALVLIVSDRASKQDWLYAASPFSRLNPASWFAGTFLVWPVFYPAFLHSHYRIINRKRMTFGFVTGALFLLTLLWILLVSRNQLPHWPVQPQPFTRSMTAPPIATTQSPVEAAPVPVSFPVTIPSADVSATPTTGSQGMLNPFPAGGATSGQSASQSNASSSNPSSRAPARVPRPANTQPNPGPNNTSGNSIPLLSVEIKERGAP